MNSYKLDTHVHTSETSPCGNISSTDLVKLYKEAGYYGVVITDHYFSEYFEALGNISWDNKIDIFLEGYKNALQAGEKAGLKVFQGMELRFDENFNDYLVFGIDESFLKEYKELYKLGLSKFRELIADKNIMIYQAHPFRPGLIPAHPDLLDGIEVYNGNIRHNPRNNKALELAQENNLRMLSGSDFHELEDLARGGVIVGEPVETDMDFIKVLKENKVIGLIKSDI
jgi:predicted metal-dependent phosphoesterase TrpH